jgi:hypothetical protein
MVYLGYGLSVQGEKEEFQFGKIKRMTERVPQ